MNDPNERPGAARDNTVALTLPALWQSKNTIDTYLRHQWPPKTHFELRPSGLDCLITVMRHVVSYLPEGRRNLTLNWAKEGDVLTKSFWSLVWMDYDKAGSAATDVLRGKFLDEYSKNKTARNGNPTFQTLLDSPRAFMSDFWSQPEMLTLNLCMVCDRNQVWHRVTENRLRLIWSGDITLQQCVNNIGYHHTDEGSDEVFDYPEMFTEFGAPEILTLRYLPRGHQVQNLYDQMRGFNVNLYGFDDEDRYVVKEETGYRLIAVVKLRTSADGHDAVRLYRPNGVLSGSCTETDYYPTSWTVSDSEPYSLVYARFELPDMYNFVRYPELPVNTLGVRDFTLADPQHGQSRTQPTTLSAPAAQAAKPAGTKRTAVQLKIPKVKIPLRKPKTYGKQEASGKPSEDTSGKTSQETSGTSGKPSQDTSTSGRPSQSTHGNPNRDTSGNRDQEPSRNRGRETSRNHGRESFGNRDQEDSRNRGRQTSRNRSGGRQTSRNRGRQTSRNRGRQTSRNRGRQTSRNRGRQTHSRTVHAEQSVAPRGSHTSSGRPAIEQSERQASHAPPQGNPVEHSGRPEPGSSRDASDPSDRFVHPDRINNIILGQRDLIEMAESPTSK